MVVPLSVANSLKASMAPRAVPNATAETQHPDSGQHSAGVVQEAALQRRVVQSERTLGRDENVIQFKVVAAGAAQSHHLPGVINRSRFYGREQHHRVRPPRFIEARPVVVHHSGVDEEPVGVGYAAGIVPPSADPVAAGRRPRFAQGTERPGAAEVRRPGQTFPAPPPG